MKEHNKKLTEELHQKWIDGAKIAQLGKEYNLSKDAIYKRLHRLKKENAQDNDASEVQTAEISEMYNYSDNVSNDSYSDNNYDNMHEEIAEELESQNSDNSITSFNSQAETGNKTGFVTGRTMAYIAVAIVLSLAVVFWWPQISGVLKSAYSKIHGKITGHNNDELHVVQPEELAFNPQY